MDQTESKYFEQGGIKADLDNIKTTLCEVKLTLEKMRSAEADRIGEIAELKAFVGGHERTISNLFKGVIATASGLIIVIIKTIMDFLGGK